MKTALIKKLGIVLFGILMSVSSSWSQNHGVAWKFGMNDSTFENGPVIPAAVQSFQGRTIIAGNFDRVADFDPGPGQELLSAVNTDGFIGIYNSDGSPHLVKAVGLPNDDEIIDMVVSNEGNIYVIGRFTYATNFDPAMAPSNIHYSAGIKNLLLAKYDSNLVLQWSHNFGSIGAHISSVEIDEEENVYILGDFKYATDFNPGDSVDIHSSNGDYDVYFSKYDKYGVYEWTKTMGGYSDDLQSAIAAGNGFVYVFGKFQGTCDLDPGVGISNVTSNGGIDFFVIRMDTSGNFISGNSFGGSNQDYVADATIDSAGNLLFICNIVDSVDLDPSTGVHPFYTGNIIVKWSSTGSFLWGIPYISYPLWLSTHGSEIYLGGVYNGTKDFDPSNAAYYLTSQGGYDIFITQISDSGSFIWAKSIGGASNEQIVYIDGFEGGCNVVGAFLGSIDADPGTGVIALQTLGGGVKNSFFETLDTDGAVDTAYQLGDMPNYNGNDVLSVMDSTSSGDIVVSARIGGKTDFEPSIGVNYLSPTNGVRHCIVRYTPAGQLISGFSLPLSGAFGQVIDVQPSSIAEYMIVGMVRNDTIDIDPSSAIQIVAADYSVKTYFIAHYDINDSLVSFASFTSHYNYEVSGVEATGSGHYIIAGNYRDSITFGDTTHISGGYVDIFLFSLSDSSTIDWAWTTGSNLSNGQEKIIDLARDDLGNILLSGNFEGTVNFNPLGTLAAETAIDESDIFIAKYSPTGELIWVKSLEAIGTTAFAFHIEHHNNRIYIGGYCHDSLDVDPGTNTSWIVGQHYYSSFISAYDDSGYFVWSYQVGGEGISIISDIQIDHSGNPIFSSKFRGTVYPMPDSVGYALNSQYMTDDCLVLLLDSNGLYRSHIPIVSIGHIQGNQLLPFPDGSLVLGGYYLGPLEFQQDSSNTNLNSNGSTDPFLVRFNPCASSYGELTMTSCASYVAPSGKEYFMSGIYSDTTYNASGCDSIIDLTLTIVPTEFHSDSVSVCDTFYWSTASSYYTSSGMYTDTFVAESGCDSVAILYLEVLKDSTFINQTDCDSFYWSLSDSTYTESGIYQHVSSNAYGCDSIVNLILTIHPSIFNEDTVNACDSFLWPSNNLVYNYSGIYIDTFTNGNGCDSIVHLHLTIINSSFNSIFQSACDSFYWEVNSENYFISGVYYDTLINAQGCDSILELNLNIFNSTSSIITEIECDSFTWSLNNIVYVNSGIYFDTLSNSLGCDSVIQLSLTILNSTTALDTVHACDSYTWIANNTTYSLGGNYIDTILNSSGCDSIVSLHLEISHTISDTDTIYSCDNYLWPGNGNLYLLSGIYSETFQSASGCDSIETIVLFINYSSNANVTIATCDSFQWVNGQTYFESGVYQDTFVSVSGCDSVVNLNLVLHFADSTTIEIESCISYLWTVNDSTYNQSGTFVDVLETVYGCDSVIILHLEIDSVNTQVIMSGDSLMALAQMSEFQWFNCGELYTPIPGEADSIFVPSSNGMYAVMVVTGGCIDTSDCIEITGLGLEKLETYDIRLYPNPTNGGITVNFSDPEIAKLLILRDAVGRLVDEFEVEQRESFNLQLKGAAGVYTVEVIGNNFTLGQFRIVKY